MMQLDIFSPPPSIPRARTEDPATSHQAARSVDREKLRASQRAIIAILGKGNMTDEIIAEIYTKTMHTMGFPLQSPSGLRTRRSELVAKGLVEDSGVRVKMKTGRNAIVWRLCD